jgi:hypothetical protein
MIFYIALVINNLIIKKMKNYLLLLGLIMISITAFGQSSIPNGNFESWTTGTYEYPQNYPITSNTENFYRYQLPFNVVKTTDSYHGNYAVQLTTYASGTNTSFGYFLNSNPNGDPTKWTGGMPYNQMPTGIRGYYKYNQSTADTATIIVTFSKAGVNVGTYFIPLSGLHSSYALFNYTFYPALTVTPDSVIFCPLSCKIDPNQQSPTGPAGSTLIIDSVSFTGVASQPAMFNGDFESWQSQTLYKPNDWYSESGNGQGINRTTDKVKGTYAIELTTFSGTRNNSPAAEPGNISTGYYPSNCSGNCYQQGGFPYSKQSDTLSFYYKYAPTSGDTGQIHLNFKKNGSTIWMYSYFIQASANYQLVQIPFNMGQTPDTVIINIQSSVWNHTSLSYVGSVLKIDEFYFKSQPLSTIQIPNNGFEEWASIGNCIDPTSWMSSYAYFDTTGSYCALTRSSDHYPASVGRYSVKITNDTGIFNNGTFPGKFTGWGFLNSGQNSSIDKFPVSGHPKSLCGYYKFLPQNGDTMNINFFIYHNGSEITSGSFQTHVAANSWTPFKLYVSDTLYSSVDSVRISLSASNEPKNYHHGPLGNSVLYVDNLSFDSYITASINPEIVYLGNGTNTNSNSGYPAPYGQWYNNSRVQYLITAAELTSLGLTANSEIKSIGFNNSSVAGVASAPITISMGNTSTSSYTSGSYVPLSSLTTVYYSSYYTPVTGWNNHNFSSGFYWDGSSNIAVDVYYGYVGLGYTNNAATYYTTTSFNSALSAYSDGSNVQNISSGNFSQQRANMKITFIPQLVPGINSLIVTSTDTSSLSFTANIGSINNDTAYNRGFICWQFDETNRTIDDTLVIKINQNGAFGTGQFSGTFTGLNPGTTYSVRAYATNSSGTGYTSVQNFSTRYPEPSGHSTTFNLNYSPNGEGYWPTTNMDFDYANSINASGYLILERYGSYPTSLPTDGIQYNINDTFGNSRVVKIVDYYLDYNYYNNYTYVDNYNLCGTYYYKLIPFNWNGSSAATINYNIQDTIPSGFVDVYLRPELTTTAPSAISSSTMIATGTLSDGCDNAYERGFVYNTSSNWTPNRYNDNYVSKTGSFSSGNFSDTITGLYPSTEYFYAAYAINNADINYGNIYSDWTTSAEPPNHAGYFTATPYSSQNKIYLTFPACTTIACQGYIILEGTDYAPSGLPVDGTEYYEGDSIGNAKVARIINYYNKTDDYITNLAIGHVYHYVLIPYTWNGYSGRTMNYKTTPTIPTASAAMATIPSLNLDYSVTNLSSTGATVVGQITSTGGENPSVRGICYHDTISPPTLADSTSFETGSFGTGTYNINLSNLQPETYYTYRAYATNTAGTGYSYGTNSFWTYSAEPSGYPASFTAVTNSTTQIQLNFSAPNTLSNCDGYLIKMSYSSTPSNLPQDGNSYSISSFNGYESVCAIITNGSATSELIGNLNPGHLYYFAVIPFNWNGNNSETFNYRTQASIPTANAYTIVPPSLTTSQPASTAISSTTADITGNITYLGSDSNATTRGICYKIYASGDPETTDSTKFQTGSFGTGSFTLTLTGLIAESRYKFRAYALNSAGTGYGSVSYDFYTLSTEPSAHAASFTATANSTTQIDLSFSAASTLTNADGYIIIMKQGSAPASLPADGSAYSTGTVIGDATVAAYINNTSSTSTSIYGLNPGLNYYFKLIPFNWDQNNSLTFNYRTQATVPVANANTIVPPLVNTSSTISNLSSTAVDISGDITATNGANATTRGICYKVYAAGDPTTANSTNPETGSFGTGSFTLSLTGLAAETRYKFRAYAINSAGTGYGSTSYDFYTYSIEPTAHAGSFTSTTVSTSQIDLSFSAASTISNADGYIILMRQGALPTTLPTDGTGYSGGNTIGSSTVAAIITSNTITSASIPNLTPGMTYYFLLIPYNWDLTNTQTYNYYTTPTIPNTNANTIVSPTVTTSAVISNISPSAADVSGSITATGGANSTARGICYKVYGTGDPTTANSVVNETGTFGVSSYTKTLTLSSQTHYQGRAYATNSAGTGYGTTYDFFTLSSEPTAHPTTFNANVISQYKIKLTFPAPQSISLCNGYIIMMSNSGYPATNPVDGNGYTVGSHIGGSPVVAAIVGTTDTFVDLTNLTPAYTYFFTIYPFNWDGANNQTYNYRTSGTPLNAYGYTVIAPTLTTDQTQQNITTSAADLSGSITDNGGSNVSQRGFVYKVYSAGDPTSADVVNSQSGNFSTGSFTVSLSGLSPETRYKYRSYAYRGTSNYYGPTSYDFYTLSSEPTAHAASFTATTVSTTQIDLAFSQAGTLTNADGYIVLMRQGTTPLNTPSDGSIYPTFGIIGNSTVVGVIYSTTVSSLSVMNLAPGINYYFALYPFNWDGTNAQTFNYRTAATVPTANASTIVVPALTTNASSITNVTTSSASLDGEITSTGGSNSTTRGICYKVYATGEPSTSDLTNFETGSFGAGSYTRNLTGLSPETRYKLRAYAINPAGTGYASTSVDFYTLSPEPAAHASFFTATTASVSQINLSFPAASTITDADGYIVLIKQGSAITGIPADAVNYTIGSPVGDATVCAIINNISTANATITSISAGNTYYFALIPYNWNGSVSSTLNYRTAASIPTSYTTTIVAPSVTTSTVITGISTSGATISGDITSTNGANATKRGICYKDYTGGDPTLSDFINQQSGNFGIGTFSQSLYGLNPETRYKVRAFATNSAGTGFGLTYDLFTLSNEPLSHAVSFTATTSSTSQIDLAFSAAKTIINADGYIIIQRQDAAPTGLPADGQSYTIGSSLGNGSVAAIINDTAVTESFITSVSAGNSYYFILIPFSWDGTNSQTINYYTSGSIPVASASTITVPVMATSIVENISTTTADIQGLISNTGGRKPATRGICYKVYSVNDPVITSDPVYQESGSFGTGSYSGQITSLIPETRYKARSFATNTAGTGYGNTLEFFTLSTEPLTHANTFTAVSYTSSQIILNFQPANKIVNADGYIIIQSQGTIPNGLPADGNAYSTGNARGNGIVAAIINDVYQSSITITNLNSGTRYYYTLIPFNWNGNNPETYNYFTNGSIPQANATTLVPCSINASMRVYGPSIICHGDSIKLEVDTGNNMSYQWTRNNILIPGATTNVLYASATGEYKVFINNTLCSVVSDPFNLSNYPVEPPVISSTGDISPCSNDSMMLSTSQYSTYLWSNGKTTQNNWVSVSGNYYVIVTDHYGCKVKSYDYTVNAAAMEPPSICLVTVDSLSGKNLIVWERPATTVIDSYYIYKESTQAGIYNLIGKLGYNDLSVFLDTNSNPTVKADRYRISIIDTCGIESAPSQVHKTMHLTINKGINGENNLIWDYYEGFTFSTYKILRGTNPGNMRTIALIQNNLTSYSDINPPMGLLFYQVVVVKPDPCYPAIFRAQTSSGPYSQSASNLKDYSTIGKDYLSAYPSELYIAKEKNSTNSFTVFTSLTTWSAYATEKWIDVIADLANKSIVIIANSDNTDPNPRVSSLIIKYSPVDSLIVMVIQKGTVGIADHFNKGISANVYPNPFTRSTNIEYELTRSTKVNIAVYDMFGKLVSPLCNEKQQAGKHLIQFSTDDSGYTEGIYFIIFEADGIRTVKKLIRIH